MKLEVVDDKIIIYLIDYFFESTEKKQLVSDIKDIFIRLMEYYHIELKGYYDVYVYENIKYGTILEIIKQDELLFQRELIDIKVKFYKNVDFYLKTKDYFVFKNYKNIYYNDDYYYININYIDNILNVIEFVDILYKEKDNYLNKMLFIQ